ncbi:MAG: hypothetical protein ACW9XH_05715 [Candidatus Nitrosopumilus sp. bin_32a]
MFYDFPFRLKDKIFEIRCDSDNAVVMIVSYFPFSKSEQQEIISILGIDGFTGFNSIFTDNVSDDEWNKTKDQIKKKFKDELFDIDDV